MNRRNVSMEDMDVRSKMKYYNIFPNNIIGVTLSSLGGKM